MAARFIVLNEIQKQNLKKGFKMVSKGLHVYSSSNISMSTIKKWAHMNYPYGYTVSVHFA